MIAPKLNASSLDLRPLYYFVRVAEGGSFSRASATLSISQPALSRFIKRLEDDLQVQLLFRNGRGVRLTEAGERLFEHAGAILRNLSQAQTEVIALRGTPVGNVSIALPPMLGGMLSGELVRRLRSDYPLISICLREGFAAEALDWLGSGTVDIGVLFNPPHVATLILEHVLDDKIDLVGTPGSLDLVAGASVPAKRLLDLPMVLPPAPHRLRALIDNAAHEAGIRYTVLPSALLHDEVKEGRLQSWPIVKPSIPTKLYLATSMQRPITMATKIVAKSIKDLFVKYRRSLN